MVLKDSNSFQNLFMKLCGFWNDFGCVLIPPAQTEISSPLFHPNTFFGMIGDDNIDTMYFQPHVASRESDNIKFNVQNYTFLKFQIVIKSEVLEPQKLFLNSLEHIGLDLKDSDIKFSNEDYENFIFRINAFGYKIFFNNILIAKLHYVQNVGYHDFASVPLIILYDLDKILMILQKKNDLYETSWNGLEGKEEISYSDLMLKSESENYEFVKNMATNEIILQELNDFKTMASILIKEKTIIPAYTSILKAKYCLDILCSRNYIMYNDKLDHSKDLRDLVDLCCEEYLQKLKRINK
ncbi:MAG: glycine--tRNA ligase subunit alpha [Rickettsiales bacterium]|nr:glycine--tRNA ligase subunit alpha [Rickettsiales bacterium]